MMWDRVVKINNIILPIVGLGLMIFYEVCDTSCTYLQGTFAGVDLKMVGILHMAVLLLLNLPSLSHRHTGLVNNLRTMMLSGAVGGEVILVRFQIVHNTYCPFCMAFGLCILVLFTAHFQKMSKLLALVCFSAGIIAFALFFKGAVLPLYL